MTNLKKLFALVLVGTCILGNTCAVSAATKAVTSYSQQGTLESVTVSPDQEVHLYGSVICTDGSATGHVTQWSARMYGDLAVAYSKGACSFGKNGSETDIMGKSYFVVEDTLQPYSKSASMFTYYKWATTCLYY